jgi:hypothetical protein
MSPGQADGRPPAKIGAQETASAGTRIQALERQLEVLTAELEEAQHAWNRAWLAGYDYASGEKAAQMRERDAWETGWLAGRRELREEQQ